MESSIRAPKRRICFSETGKIEIKSRSRDPSKPGGDIPGKSPCQRQASPVSLTLGKANVALRLVLVLHSYLSGVYCRRSLCATR